MEIIITIFITAGLTWLIVSVLIAGKESDANNDIVFIIVTGKQIGRAHV